MNNQILSTDFPVDDGAEEQYIGFSSNEETDDESDKEEWDKKTNYGNQKIVFQYKRKQAKTVHSPEENETILSSTSFIRTVVYKVSLFQKLGYAFEMYQTVPEE